jgi:hydroxymethylbilane synthase
LQGIPIRIGTRGSPLALAQAHEVRQRLMQAHNLPQTAFEIVVIKTTGDAVTDRPLADIGGKGLFTKEIEQALFDNSIDLAVHSMKDVQTVLPDGLMMPAILEREDVRDAFISLKYDSLDALPEGAVVGTSSLRRQAQVQRQRADLSVIGFRGNVQTRLRKLEEGLADATFLACAGLKRLGMKDAITTAIEIDTMLPAVAQAAIGIETRSDDNATADLVTNLNHNDSNICVTSERAFLKILDGSCRTPIAGLAYIEHGNVTFRGETLSPDGTQCLTVERQGKAQDAIALAEAAAHDLLDRGARDLMS